MPGNVRFAIYCWQFINVPCSVR